MAIVVGMQFYFASTSRREVAALINKIFSTKLNTDDRFLDFVIVKVVRSRAAEEEVYPNGQVCHYSFIGSVGRDLEEPSTPGAGIVAGVEFMLNVPSKREAVEWYSAIGFGTSQCPEIADYACDSLTAVEFDSPSYFRHKFFFELETVEPTEYFKGTA